MTVRTTVLRRDRRARFNPHKAAERAGRLSEALDLTAERVDLTSGVIVFESLKKRRKGVYRAVSGSRRVPGPTRPNQRPYGCKMNESLSYPNYP